MTTSPSFSPIITKKNWQIFLLAFAFSFISGILELLISYYWNNWWISLAFGIIGLAFLLSYPLLVWNALRKLLTHQDKFEKTDVKTTVAVSVIMLISMIAAPLIEIRFLSIALSVTFLFCLVFIASVPAKQLKSIQLKRNAGIWEYTPETFLFLIWPLGVWWLQPDINDVVERPITIKE